MKNSFANALIKESSPYLLQHAYNPVQWYPWGAEALALAKEKDLPILVSIGYSACHWCHVMERESFEDEAVAAYMNLHFINIKIDREERPDLDHFYMDAVQAINGSGGWPLNVFLTPSKKPFYGGTYFPPKKAFNRPSWLEVLASISEIWNNKRQEAETQAETLLAHLRQGNAFTSTNKLNLPFGEKSIYSLENCKKITKNLLESAEVQEGGFGKAPKFLQTPSIQYLLQYAHLYNDDACLQHAIFTLKKMLRGGIYDQLQGGISRYSTDNEWLVPHFEKMLYDNALLVNVLCDAWQITANPLFKNAIRTTLHFLETVLKHPQGGYYTAIDADSEGIEGKYYVWSKMEILELLGKNAELFCSYYNVTEGGNWEGDNILNIIREPEDLASEYGMDEKKMEEIIDKCRHILLQERNKRIAPQLDDKILLNGNALLLTAFCKAYAALQDDAYKSAAEELYANIKENFSYAGGIEMAHSYKNGQKKIHAFLDDYAYLIEGLILLQEITGNQVYLTKAREHTVYVLNKFEDTTNPLMFYTAVDQQDILVRKVEVFDGATPSANAVMAKNLIYIGIVFDKKDWISKGENMLSVLTTAFINHPTSFAVWASCYLLQTVGINEIVVTGNFVNTILKEIIGKFIPNKILQSTVEKVELDSMPLLKNKLSKGGPHIYLCKNYSCQAPVNDMTTLLHSIKKLSIK